MPRRDHPFRRYVEIGRVAYINYGPHYGKLVTIIDVLDGNRAFVDGPTTGVPRQQINFKWLALTDIKIDIAPSVGQKGLKKAFTAANVLEKWENSNWAKKIHVRESRANTTDFERFQLIKAKKTRSALIKTELRKLKK